MLIEQILTPDDAKKMLEVVSELEWHEGQARTEAFTGTIKQNFEILPGAHTDTDHLLKIVTQKIMGNNAVSVNCIPLILHPPKFNKYGDGGQYKEHTDAPWMGHTRTDISCTIWLSEPTSYEGGGLRIGEQEFKGTPGQGIFYNCDVVHSVTPVTSGERVCVVSWIQSRIRDPRKRQLITDFRAWLAKMEGTEMFAEGDLIYSALLKRWID